MERVNLRWSAIIVLSAAAVEAVIFQDAPAPIRPAVVLWFILFCPGIAFIQLLGLDDLAHEVILAVGLSLAIALFVAICVLYAGLWSPNLILMILVVLSQIGVLCQILLWNSRRMGRRVKSHIA